MRIGREVGHAGVDVGFLFEDVRTAARGVYEHCRNTLEWLGQLLCVPDHWVELGEQAADAVARDGRRRRDLVQQGDADWAVVDEGLGA